MAHTRDYYLAHSRWSANGSHHDARGASQARDHVGEAVDLVEVRVPRL